MKKLSFILAIVLIVILGCALPGIAFAASETVYTGVLEDLQKDETFDVAQFPVKEVLSENDKVMDVIQIAESNTGELFLYVYQPQAGKFTASEVRISTSIGENLAPKDYELTLLDRDDTLEKYKVEDLQVKTDVVRYYVVVQLARSWDSDVDQESTPGSTTSSVFYPIAKQYTATTLEGVVSYTEIHTDVLTILPEQRFDGSIRYSDGFNLYATQCDSWFVAFTCDYTIDKLMDADVGFVTTGYTTTIIPFVGKQTTYDEPISHTFTLTDTDEVTHEKRFLFFKSTYTWNRIEKVSDFIGKEDLKDETKEQLKDKQWVLRFTETSFGISGSGVSGTTTSWGTEVSDVTILRLYFESAGEQYNLGVVSNKVTPDLIPDNNPDDPLGTLNEAIDKLLAALKTIGDFFVWLGEHWWFIIIGIVAIALIVWLIIEIVKKGAAVVFKALGKVLWWVLKIIFYIVTLPIWLIIWGVRAIKKKKEQ